MEIQQFTAKRFTSPAFVGTEFMLLPIAEPGVDESMVRILVLTDGAAPVVFTALASEVATDQGFADVCLGWISEQEETDEGDFDPYGTGGAEYYV